MKNRTSKGFAALPVVAVIALTLTLSLLMLFRAGLLHKDQAAKSQLRADHHQREEALMRALVVVFPKKAIACMKAGYAVSDDYSWNTIFAESVAMAGSAQNLTPEMAGTLGLGNARRGDVGDNNSTQVQSWITSLSGIAGSVTPGTTAYASVFRQPAFAGKVPPLLDMDGALQETDALRPVVTLDKHYATQDPGLLADVGNYPTYNLIPYPNIRFGYAAAGEPFVAKRNWWAFTVTYGSAALGASQSVPPMTRHYVLSLYEIPSQLPIEGAAFAEIGRYRDGAAWNAAAITISGGVYADRLSMDGAFGAKRLAGRQSIEMVDRLNLDGSEVGGDFDAAGVREQLQVQRKTDVLPVALPANSGRLTFIPIQRGGEFLRKLSNPADVTPWESYTRGAEQCDMSVEAISMVSLENQTPTAIRVRYKASNGSTGQVVLQRGVNWPYQIEAAGASLPFQTEPTDNNRPCLTFFPGLLNDWLQRPEQAGAPVTVNHRIYFNTDQEADPLTVLPASDPPGTEDMGVIIRKGRDLTPFASGLSMLAPLRVYVGDDLNATPLAAPPAGSGLLPTDEYYPPMSIFAAELRIGTTSFLRPFEHHGQISTLSTGGTATWTPLDVKSGSDDTVHTDSIAADLRPLRSPADLPPVHQMNWLVVIEEISQD